METTLRTARIDDLQTILTWITSAQDLKFWGGSALSFPPEQGRTWQEIGANDDNACSMLDMQGLVIGFGQTMPREPGSLHLGRIILSPAVRGLGLGKVLVEGLIRCGMERFNPACFTLNVYRTNTPAVALYRSLGFVVVPEEAGQDSFKMVLQVEKMC